MIRPALAGLIFLYFSFVGILGANFVQKRHIYSVFLLTSIYFCSIIFPVRDPEFNRKEERRCLKHRNLEFDIGFRCLNKIRQFMNGLRGT